MADSRLAAVTVLKRRAADAAVGAAAGAGWLADEDHIFVQDRGGGILGIRQPPEERYARRLLRDGLAKDVELRAVIRLLPGDRPGQRLEADGLAEREPLLTERHALFVAHKVAANPGCDATGPQDGERLRDDLLCCSPKMYRGCRCLCYLV